MTAGELAHPVADRTAPRRSKRLLWLAMALFVLTRLVILLVLRPAYSDLPLYHRYAVLGIDRAKTPFKDFPIEYPPAAWWVVAAPRLVQSERLPPRPSSDAAEQSYERYTRLFRVEQCLFDLFALWLFVHIVKLRRPEWTGGLTLCYVMSTALLGHLLYDRLDTGLLMLLLAWAYTWLRSDRLSLAMLASYGLLGLSISFKVIPVIVMPFLLLAEWHAPKRLANLSTAAAGLLFGALTPFAIHYPSAGWSTLGFLQFHASRGIQVESLYASLLMPLQIFGVPLRVEHGHGGYNAVCDAFPAVTTLATIVLFAFLAACGLWALLLGARYTRLVAYRASCLVLCGAAIFSKVLSPQYFVWAFPLLLLLGAEVLARWRRPDGAGGLLTGEPLFDLSRSQKRARQSAHRLRFQAAALCLGVVAVALLTAWLFPYHYFSHLPVDGEQIAVDAQGLIPGLSPAACGVLVARNTIYLVLVLWLAAALWRGTTRAARA